MKDQQALELRSTLTLLSEARAGDRRAAEALLERHRRLLKRWGRGRVPPAARDLVDTEDLVQEALSRTLQHLGDFKSEHSGAFAAYLRRIFLHLVLDQKRRVHRKPPAAETAGRVLDVRPSPQEEAIERDRLGRYEAALRELEPSDRAAIVARLELGMKYEEMAHALGKPSPDAARKAVARAVKHLAERMASDRARRD